MNYTIGLGGFEPYIGPRLITLWRSPSAHVTVFNYFFQADIKDCLYNESIQLLHSRMSVQEQNIGQII